MMADNRRKLLNALYNDLNKPHSLSSPYKLWQQAKRFGVTLDETTHFLRTKDSYTRHVLKPIKFPRRKVLIHRPKYTACIDLMDMSALSRHNNGYKFIFVFMDGMSRFLICHLQKTKSARETTESLKKCLETPEFDSISKVWSDRGSEFYNTTFINFLKKHGIQLYSTQNFDIKVSLIERVIRTIRSKINRYLTENDTLKYYDVLGDIVKSYNRTYHRTIMDSPERVHNYNKHQTARLFEQLHSFKTCTPRQRARIIPGDVVRIASYSRLDRFYKKSKPVATKELFRVKRVDCTIFPPLYIIEDLKGNIIEGRFYSQELILTR